MTMQQPDPILAALVEQVGCYRRLAKLAGMQHEHVQQGQTEKLLEVLKSRQEVLDQISTMESTIAHAKRQWPQYIARLQPDQRAKAESSLAETKQLLEQITASDRDDAMILQQRKLTLGRQINQAVVSKQVNRNYAAAAYGKRPPQMDVTQ